MQNLMKTHLTNDISSSPRYIKANQSKSFNNNSTQSCVNVQSFREQYQPTSEYLGLRGQKNLINVVKYNNQYEEKGFEEYFANNNTNNNINGLKTAHYSNYINNNIQVCL
jgi:hypothetical protein